MKYSLYLNELTIDPNDYMARLLEVPAFTLDDIVRIVVREGSPFTEEEVRGVYAALEKATAELTERGTVATSLFTTQLSVKGVFHDRNETFTPGKHHVNLKMLPGERLLEAAQRITLEKTEKEALRPMLLAVYDLENDQATDRLVAGHTLLISGRRLKVDRQQSEQGAYLISTANGKAEVKLETLRSIPSELTVRVPTTLKKGNYQLVVRNVRGKKTIEGSYEDLLTLA